MKQDDFFKGGGWVFFHPNGVRIGSRPTDVRDDGTPLDEVEANAAEALDARPLWRRVILVDVTLCLLSTHDDRTGRHVVLASRESAVEIECMLRGGRDVRAHRLAEGGPEHAPSPSWVESEITLGLADEIRALSALVAIRRQQAYERRAA